MESGHCLLMCRHFVPMYSNFFFDATYDFYEVINSMCGHVYFLQKKTLRVSCRGTQKESCDTLSWLTWVKVLVRRYLYTRSLTGLLKLGQLWRTLFHPHLTYPGKIWEGFYKIDIFTFHKILVKDGETRSDKATQDRVTPQKIGSIIINLIHFDPHHSRGRGNFSDQVQLVVFRWIIMSSSTCRLHMHREENPRIRKERRYTEGCDESTPPARLMERRKWGSLGWINGGLWVERGVGVLDPKANKRKTKMKRTNETWGGNKLSPWRWRRDVSRFRKLTPLNRPWIDEYEMSMILLQQNKKRRESRGKMSR